MLQRIISFLALIVSCGAFAPTTPFGVVSTTTKSASTLFSGRVYGEFDGKLWDNEAKKIVYAKWDPNAPRSPLNFNPFETWDGNSPDCSGFYPGEGGYKDPLRGDVSFAIMMAERAEAEQRAAVRCFQFF